MTAVSWALVSRARCAVPKPWRRRHVSYNEHTGRAEGRRGFGEDFMKALKAGVCVAFVLSLSAVLSAGQVYGTIVADGQPVKDTDIEIKCGEEAAIKGKTAADGAYRMNVPQQGQCSLTLPTYAGKPSAQIFSSPNPALYNFAVEKDAEGKVVLKRRQ
jgi:hypothetical protein